MIYIVYTKRKFRVRGMPYVYQIGGAGIKHFSAAHNLRNLERDIKETHGYKRVPMKLVQRHIEHEPPPKRWPDDR